jgi:hypothetical protein
MAELQLPKLIARVRFPSSAPWSGLAGAAQRLGAPRPASGEIQENFVTHGIGSEQAAPLARG